MLYGAECWRLRKQDTDYPVDMENFTEECLCCEAPDVESRFQVEAGDAICCGQTAPLDGYGDTQFSAFAYDTVYTVREYSVPSFPDFSESTCTRSRSRTGGTYVVEVDETPICPFSEFTDSGCEDIYGVLPTCGSVSPSPGLQCISSEVSTETSSSVVDCSDEAVSAEALGGAGIVINYEDNPWTDVVDGMPGGESSYGGQQYTKTTFEIRKKGYPVPCWIVLTIERTDMEMNVDYLEETIFIPWGELTAIYPLEPAYGESLLITDTKLYYPPKLPPGL
jgi:hypothetical protein